MIYGDDNNFIKLMPVSIWETRQTEFAKELAPVPSDFPAMGRPSWVRDGTWTDQLGSNAKIGLVSMGGSGFTANFDYVRVYALSD